MNIIVLDFESFFSDDYTLSKMTTEAYVRDPRFEAHGVAIRWQHEGSPVFTSWYDNGGMDGNSLCDYLFQVDWENTACLCHHAQFDGLILAHHFGIRPKYWLDTLSMARQQLGNHLSASLDNVRQHFGMPLKRTPYNLFKNKHWHELDPATQREVADGACDEVESIWRIFNLLAKDFPAECYPWVDNTVRMFTEPKLVGDIPMLGQLWMQENAHKAQLLANLGVTKEQLGSDEVFAELLRKLGVEPDTKDTGKQIKYAFAKTDPMMQEMADDEDDDVRALVEARLSVKSTLQQTRSERLGYMASRGAMCVYLSAFGAHTNRDSGGDKVNWQNFTRSTNIRAGAVDLRKTIKPPKGYLTAKVDKSQIECVAEGQLVLTRDRGLVPIERVGVDDCVFDGIEWVAHDGVICRGEKKVYEYQGLIATLDHVVYTEAGTECHLGRAAREGRHLRKISAPSALREAALHHTNVRGVQNLWSARDQIQFSECAGRSGVCAPLSPAPDVQWCGDRQETQRWALRAGEFTAFHAARKCQQPLNHVLGADAIRPAVHAGLQAVAPGMRVRPGSNQGVGTAWDDRGTNNRTLSRREMEKLRPIQALKARGVQKVYDIVNAGPRHRFVVSGVLVSNCRVLNMFAGQWDVIEKFRNKEDPYVGIATQFYGFQVTKAHEKERGTGKQLELSCGYGAGVDTIINTARKGTYGPPVYLSADQGERAKELYRSTHSEVVSLWREAGRMISALDGTDRPVEWGCVEVHTGCIIGPNGTRLRYPELFYEDDPADTFGGSWKYRTRKGRVKLYGAKLVENLIQWLAWIAFQQDVCRIGKESGLWPAIREHDAGTWVIPDDQYAEQTVAWLRAEMSRPPAWMPDIPLDADAVLSERTA